MTTANMGSNWVMRPVRAPRALPADMRAVAGRLLPAVVLFYSALLPQEMRLELLGLELYPYRIASLALLPWVMRSLVQGRIRLGFADMLILAGSAWILISFISFYGSATGMVRGGALVVDIVPAYLIGRTCLQNLTDFRRFLVLIAPGALLVGITMLAETLFQKALLRPFLANIFGNLASYENGVAVGPARGLTDVRLGLLRVAGPFSHPIMAGLLLASLLPLYALSGLRKWPLHIGLAASLCAVLSISSIVFLVMIFFLVMAAYDWLQRRVEFLNWSRFIFASGIVALTLQALSQNGLVPVIIRYTLKPSTGNYRRLIWDFGMQSVREHPWFGIAYSDYVRAYWMHNSVDAQWLLLAMRHGIPAIILFFLAIMVVLVQLAIKTPQHRELDRKFYLAITVTLASFVLAGFTVAFFGGMQIWFYLLLGIFASLAMARDGVAEVSPRRIQAPVAGLR